LAFISSAHLGTSFVSGFSISESLKLSFGELEMVFSYPMLAFGRLEVIPLKNVTRWKVADPWV
jgi:hypothetical protein